MKFTERDYEKLRELNEVQLYILDVTVITYASEIKRNLFLVMLDENCIRDAVSICEEVGKELARRKNFLPEISNGKYSMNEITYDTDNHRDWLIATRQSINEDAQDKTFLKSFSFFETMKRVAM